ncbi:hypothetical protein JZ751_027360 [Albula glossodonta]|uniref:G-patch domain-containing protein n=1 Tax=Albula glossodonta TaxID=121402 RepID=A0A8T2MPS7_9TELE|nr:hypothetical protein JZ751_027360 [Albula glossodonta]
MKVGLGILRNVSATQNKVPNCGVTGRRLLRSGHESRAASLITFTAAREPDGWPGIDPVNQPLQPDSALSGEEARNFYQSILEEGGTAGESKREKRRRPKQVQGRGRGTELAQPSGTASERDGHKLLRCAQEGDLAGLRVLLEKKGCDINFQDSYYWTAIMCASYAGQRAAVKLLLHKGAAWVGVVDTQGRDARDLADQAGHDEVVRELESYGVPSERESGLSRTTNRGSGSQPSWCSVCGVEYSESEQKHRSSTLHQFSLRRPAPTPQYCLPASSAGYRMMLRTGWDPGTGLGPSGTGPKQPVRTVLKRDQRGLGYGPAPRPRVTHFRAKDTQAVQRAPRGRTERAATLSRRAERRDSAKDRNWERDFRTSFNL